MTKQVLQKRIKTRANVFSEIFIEIFFYFKNVLLTLLLKNVVDISVPNICTTHGAGRARSAVHRPNSVTIRRDLTQFHIWDRAETHLHCALFTPFTPRPKTKLFGFFFKVTCIS